ncbi:TetR family transcriptional regulator [Sphingomonas histidinilytica]|jgi:AcrR family transcriptional regulator|uniref:Transcriptional regulator, TetR family n=1 Tax=Rhizorhabdus histidinilytica TaxID=439228 RepID=A0A1T5BSB7_9SPHN|nr:TetR/AcrR family transcriptional regulator [Rhizorhabdus histidinilytica]MBO9377489.1 TetR family transcriptional regulator [Rhizorhabdus histidinilytica]QEH77506.1 TetR/AcrR family transcriptional regulator [Sphingomonas sp. C8-2]SKB50029.1 transcriptional regulator, TetR family [Rhizorhabdus histidinilytica]
MTRQSTRPGRRETKRLDRREAIIGVAHAYFLEHGYAATTMSGIAATIGGSKATLWSYFPSKEALFEAVLDRATTHFRERIISVLVPEADLETTLRSFCRHFLEKVTSPEAIALHRLIVAEAGRFPEIGEMFYQRGPNTMIRLLGDFIELGMARGKLRLDDPRKAAKLLLALCLQGDHQQVLLGRIDRVDATQIAATADTAVDFLLRAYAP